MAPSRTIAPSLTTAYLAKWFRVISNFVAGLLILGTGVLVVVLVSQGMFQSTYVYVKPPEAWTTLSTSCRLDAAGFVPSSCSEVEVAATGALPWQSIGAQLALDLRIASHNSTVFVTSCLAANSVDVTASVSLVVGERDFPLCRPTARQEILGLSAVEAVTTAVFPNGAFLLSTFSDAKPVERVDVVDTMGVRIPVTRSVSKTIIATDGTTTPTLWNQPNYATSLNSLNRFFLMQVWLVVHFVDISALVAANKIDGYHIGKTTGYATTLGWDNSHNVDNYMLLLAFQILICAVSLALLSNDGVITLEGLSGLLKNKPVLTYDILASLERRKVLLVSLVCTFFFSPLYADAIRYSYGVTGYHFWSLSLLMIAVMMALSWIALLTSLQWLPVPVRWLNRPICYSAPVFVYCTVLFVVIVEAAQSQGPVQAESFWNHGGNTLFLNINGTLYKSGATDTQGTTPVIYLLMPDLIVCVVAAWVASIAAHKVLVGYVVLDTSWTSHNDFVSQLPMPQWVTSLDLDHKNTISIGNKLYCKPSLMVLLGYCTIRDKTRAVHYAMSGETHNTHVYVSSHHSSSHDRVDTHVLHTGGNGHKGNHSALLDDAAAARQHAQRLRSATEYFVVSIYVLVPSILPWVRYFHQPQVFGKISSNRFERCKSNTHLEQGLKYTYSRGDCCG
ncbi:hypothetical protein H310_12373 [Aphanomyces invadans]|uniref:Uncharacterized protein n=1 Tax=Aphanomyces invadans TaxID=157072 RepID=A0A024TII2_9STRA|nr:hypothetical protein H310_12373 [Aphanomyces invadans]ETV93809.1 hypothetical protein H310_12373 [Aphanomyces invadans]|eukprot:XP_008877618.1 hypothetical protein H310_12373 [Aphanomyces invadans]